jgi:hypothetical protein
MILLKELLDIIRGKKIVPKTDLINQIMCGIGLKFFKCKV